ncbi:hypothetical protein HDV62DRAFT_378775 [Trichoderma sp. SZMC 28011]
MEGVHTATAQQQRGRYDTIRCSGYCSLCIRNIELRLHLLRTLVQITPSVPAPCKQKQLPIKSRAGSQALGDACRLRENMEYRVHSLKARRSNVAYIPNAASYPQADQQPSSPTYCKWTAGPPLSFQVPSTVGLQFHVPFGLLLLLALTGSAARIKSLRFHLGTKHRDYFHRPAIPGIAMDCQVPVVLCCAMLCCIRYRRDKG